MTERSSGRVVRPRVTLAVACAAVSALALSLVAAPAVLAEKSSPLLYRRAWYWEDQRQQKVQDPSGTDALTLELPNPFCPGTPVLTPEQTCKAERLPVEVRNGDYETPSMISALGFSMGLLPGSEVEKFELTLAEANDDKSQPLNAENAVIQACAITEVFGTGEARLYEEKPKYECTRADPVGKRREIGGGKAQRNRADETLVVPSADGTGTRPIEARSDDAPTHEWIFDLTPIAQAWAEEGATVTSVMLVPKAPKGDATPQNSNWRIVFVGNEDGANGVKTTLVYEPPPPVVPTTPPTTPPDDDDEDGDLPDFDSDSDTGTSTTTTSGSGFPTGGTVADVGGGDSAAPGEEGGEGGVPPIDIQGEVDTAASDDVADELSVALPWYAWLFILAGLVMYSLIRSAVVEKTTGARPDGVLAQIQRLNSDRRGGPLEAAAGTSRLAPLGAALRSVGRGLQPVAAGIRNGGGRLLSLAKPRRNP